MVTKQNLMLFLGLSILPLASCSLLRSSLIPVSPEKGSRADLWETWRLLGSSCIRKLKKFEDVHTKGKHGGGVINKRFCGSPGLSTELSFSKKSCFSFLLGSSAVMKTSYKKLGCGIGR